MLRTLTRSLLSPSCVRPCIPIVPNRTLFTSTKMSAEKSEGLTYSPEPTKPRLSFPPKGSEQAQEGGKCLRD